MKDFPGRLALRVEGDNWCAYYTEMETMDGALLLGSIRLSIVVDNPKLKQAFIGIMTDAIGDILRDVCGETPTWSARPAPEHEKAGRA